MLYECKAGKEFLNALVCGNLNDWKAGEMQRDHTVRWGYVLRGNIHLRASSMLLPNSIKICCKKYSSIQIDMAWSCKDHQMRTAGGYT